MADYATGTNSNPPIAQRASEVRASMAVHPAWQRLMHYCTELGYGEIDKLKIQDGLPVAAELTTRKVKFTL